MQSGHSQIFSTDGVASLTRIVRFLSRPQACEFEMTNLPNATLTSFFERPPLKNTPVLLVHGGAWAIPDDLVESHLNGVREAINKGWRILENGGSALDAAEEAVVIMEDDDAFDAGRGSFLNREGKVQLDALIMDGATLRAGGVGCVEHIANPIRAARKVLSESPHVY